MELLGVDIGGSGIKAAIVDLNTGELISERKRIPTPRPSEPEAVANCVDEMIKSFSWEGPVGIAFPTVIKNGKALRYGNLSKSWQNVQIDELLNGISGNECFVLNDADAAVKAEMKYGAGKNEKGLIILITIGTGLGSGVFFNGELLPNVELGRIYGKRGDIMESFAADSARKREDLNYKEFGKRINFFLSHVEQTLNPDQFIIGGGISKKMHKFSDYLDLETPIIPAKLLNNAGIIGAAIFAEEKINENK
ncbi:MAG: polyphosphate--glucose phosphotransferase [Flavobacteriales bacterium]